MELVLTRHARLAVDRRQIKRVWLRRLIHGPDRKEPGHNCCTEVWRLAIDERGDKDLVAVVRSTRRKHLLITAYLSDA